MMRSSSHNSVRRAASIPRNRRGTTLIGVIVTLFLIAGLSTALVRTTLIVRNENFERGRQAQAEWLAEAGLNRAAAQLRSQSTYAGETWDVPATDLAGIPGRVEIKIVADPNAAENSSQKLATVTADFPRDLPQRRRVVKTIRLPSASKSTTESPKKP